MAVLVVQSCTYHIFCTSQACIHFDSCTAHLYPDFCKTQFTEIAKTACLMLHSLHSPFLRNSACIVILTGSSCTLHLVQIIIEHIYSSIYLYLFVSIYALHKPSRRDIVKGTHPVVRSKGSVPKLDTSPVLEPKVLLETKLQRITIMNAKKV